MEGGRRVRVRYCCPICGYSNTDPRILVTHIREDHEFDKCPCCKFEGKLYQHLSSTVLKSNDPDPCHLVLLSFISFVNTRQRLRQRGIYVKNSKQYFDCTQNYFQPKH